MDYPSASEDDDSDFLVEEHDETQENDSHVIDSDMVLSSSDSDESSLSGDVQEDCFAESFFFVFFFRCLEKQEHHQ